MPMIGTMKQGALDQYYGHLKLLSNVPVIPISLSLFESGLGTVFSDGRRIGSAKREGGSISFEIADPIFGAKPLQAQLTPVHGLDDQTFSISCMTRNE
jgi:hypothetical protein